MVYYFLLILILTHTHIYHDRRNVVCTQKKSLCQLWNPPFSFDFFISQTLLTHKCLYDVSNTFTNAFILGSLLNESFWRCLLVAGSIRPSNALDGQYFDSEYVVSQLFCTLCEMSHTSWKGSASIFISLFTDRV